MSAERNSVDALKASERDEMLERAMARHQYAGEALIEILHTAQQLYGFLSRPLLERIARGLKLPPSKVLGVATFYHLFRFAPRHPHSAVICLGTACYGAGACDLLAEAQHCANLDSERWTIETVRCAGACGLAPLVVLDDQPCARVSPDALAEFFRRTK
jgi:bidirectional [NiFe] hydrogenase diaphorase subunit